MDQKWDVLLPLLLGFLRDGLSVSLPGCWDPAVLAGTGGTTPGGQDLGPGPCGAEGTNPAQLGRESREQHLAHLGSVGQPLPSLFLPD